MHGSNKKSQTPGGAGTSAAAVAEREREAKAPRGMVLVYIGRNAKVFCDVSRLSRVARVLRAVFATTFLLARRPRMWPSFQTQPQAEAGDLI